MDDSSKQVDKNSFRPLNRLITLAVHLIAFPLSHSLQHVCPELLVRNCLTTKAISSPH